MKLWTHKFLAGLLFVLLYVVNARLTPLDETTGERPPLLPHTDHTIFSFLFLLVFLFAVSHAGSWVLWKLRRHDAEPSEPASVPRGKKKRPKRR